MSRFRLALIGAVCALFALAAASAHAAFPGVNGRIATSFCQDGASCNNFFINAMNSDGTGQAPVFADTLGFQGEDPSYSADGRWITFQRCEKVGIDFNCGIAIVDARGQNLKQLTPTIPYPFPDYPSFSPDGSQIVFMLNFDIWVMGSDGSNPHAITSGSTNDDHPDFSPDGSKIVFNRDGVLTLMTPTGGSPTAIPGSSHDESPDFAPDGSRIVFQNCTPQCRIAVTGLDGSGRHFLTTPASGIDNREAAFSPDGTTVVFEQRVGSGSTVLYTVDSNGSTTPKLLTSAGDFKSSWGRVPTPSVDSAPTIGGGATARVGHALTATPGAANWGGATSFQWFQCSASCNPIAGATGSTYKPTNADLGQTLMVRQTQSDAGGSASGDSAATAKVLGEPGAKIARTGTVNRKGTAPIALNCPETQSGFCKGKVTLKGNVATAARTLGSGSFNVGAGKRGKAKVKLTGRARAALARSHKLKLRATVVSRDDAGNKTVTRATVTLKRRHG